jgi:16S rRNA (guanine966-N2)-methyltransferase
MRVIAGTAKGVPLKAPNVAGLRPTSDLIRGAIFDILGQFFDADTKVLDLYAGTGALGIEALSRGAGWADFVEQNAKVCAVIRENLKAAGFPESAKVYCLPVERASLAGPYDLIFMDPPYAYEPDITPTLALLRDGGRLVLEHSRRSSPSRDHLIRQRRHGDTVVSFYGEAA